MPELAPTTTTTTLFSGSKDNQNMIKELPLEILGLVARAAVDCDYEDGSATAPSFLALRQLSTSTKAQVESACAETYARLATTLAQRLYHDLQDTYHVPAAVSSTYSQQWDTLDAALSTMGERCTVADLERSTALSSTARLHIELVDPDGRGPLEVAASLGPLQRVVALCPRLQQLELRLARAGRAANGLLLLPPQLALQHCLRLHTLVLSHVNHPADLDFVDLSDCQHLEVLDVLGASDFQADRREGRLNPFLRSLPRGLAALRLSNLQLTADDVRTLDLPSFFFLRSLCLKSNFLLGADAVQHLNLAHCRALEQLNISGTSIRTQADLEPGLSNSRTLRAVRWLSTRGMFVTIEREVGGLNTTDERWTTTEASSITYTPGEFM